MVMSPVAVAAPPLAVSAELVLGAVLVGFLLLIAGLVGLWRLVGKGPKRNRAYKRARDLLAAGDWQGAKLAVQEIRAVGIPNPIWAGRINNLEGEVLRRTADAALEAGKYEEALELYLGSAKLLGSVAMKRPPRSSRMPPPAPDFATGRRQAVLTSASAGAAGTAAAFWLGLGAHSLWRADG